VEGHTQAMWNCALSWVKVLGDLELEKKWLKVLTNHDWCCFFVDQFSHVAFGKMKTFGETIREIRESRNLLLREVAAKLEVDPSYLSRIENGTKRPTREQVVTLAGILHEDKDKLLVLYLGERVVYELKDEEDLAIDAIIVAEKRIRYKASNKNSKKKLLGGTNKS
jgi:HTH-type transcriptional regulator, competence development regulator